MSEPSSKDMDRIDASFAKGTITLEDMASLRMVRAALTTGYPITPDTQREMVRKLDSVIDSARLSNWKGD